MFLGPPCWAAQVYSVITQKCELHSGFIVNLDQEEMLLLTLEGRAQSVSLEQIDQVLIYNVLENPISTIDPSPELQNELRKVYLDSSGEPTTIGWPVRFIEDLVVFYDLQGKTHIYSLDKIIKIRPAKESLAKVKKRDFKKVSLDHSSALTECRLKQKNRKLQTLIQPTRILADKIKLSAFFHDYYEGYVAINSFQERTYLYARPYLFDGDSRLGIIFGDFKDAEGASNQGFYFKWSTGEPYRFQSESAFGWVPMKHTNVVGPVGGVTSSVKSHFFHAYFAGNLLNIPAGKEVIFNGDVLDPERNIQFENSFNYMGLIGGDYGPFSFSFGYFFPAFGIQLGSEAREVLGSQPTTALRLMYTTEKWQYSVTGALIDFGSGNPSTEDINAQTVVSNSYYNDTTLPSEFSFKATFLRGSVDFDLTKVLSLGAGGLIVAGDYDEVQGSNANFMNFKKTAMWFSLSQEFSEYSAVHAHIMQFADDLDGEFGGTALSRDELEVYYYGVFEFIF